MSEKAKLQTVVNELTQAVNPDPFAPENLRLSQEFAEQTPVKKVLNKIPVRKPGQQDWVRVRAGEEWSNLFAMIELRDEREEFVVTAALQAKLAKEAVKKKLYLAQNRQGVVFFWPTRLMNPDGKDNDWWKSGREAAEMAMTKWVRVKANMSLGSYEILEAQADYGEPEWPEGLSFWDLIQIAFRDHLIDSLDHIVVKRLQGRG
jgi:hypothetical protein